MFHCLNVAAKLLMVCPSSADNCDTKIRLVFLGTISLSLAYVSSEPDPKQTLNIAQVCSCDWSRERNVSCVCTGADRQATDTPSVATDSNEISHRRSDGGSERR
jgi:hypothetical protein